MKFSLLNTLSLTETVPKNDIPLWFVQFGYWSTMYSSNKELSKKWKKMPLELYGLEIIKQ